MAFIEERLPIDIERNAQGGPQMSVAKFIAASGKEKRNRNWNQFRRRYDVSYGVQLRVDDKDEDNGFDRILDFYHVQGGETDGFRFRDWSDYKIGNFFAATLDADNTGFIAVGDGAATTFQTIKRRTVGANTDDRTIVKIALDDSGDPIYRLISITAGIPTELTRVAAAPGAGEFSVDVNTGIVTTGDVFTASDTLQAAAEFDVPVRFDSDVLEIQMVLFETGSVPPIMIRELRST